MSVHSPSGRVFGLLATCLCTAFLCLHQVLRGEQQTEPAGSPDTEEAGASPLFRFSLAFLVCYCLLKYCLWSAPRQASHLRGAAPAPARKVVLETYYEHQLKLSPHVLGHSKSHVTKIVSELVKVGKAEHQDFTLTFRGDFVQIGSAYEQHKINSPDCFDVLVPIKVPQLLKLEPAFDIGRNELPFNLRGTAVCRLKPSCSSEWSKYRKNFGDCFCVHFQKKSVLSSTQVLRWFYSKMHRCLNVIRYQCEERCSLTLSVVNDQLILKLLPKSDYVCCHISMSVRLIPAVHVGDSVFLVAQPWTSTESALGPLKPEAFWHVYLSKHEQKFLNWLKVQTPVNSCHLKCLQILKALRDVGCKDFDQEFSVQWNTILCSYNMKTALFHLLLKGPLDAWDEKFLMERLEDLIKFWRERLQKQELMHFFLGNKNIPDFLTVPRKIKDVLPVNLLAGFDAALLDMVSFQLLNTWNRAHQIMKLNNHKHWPRNY
ncbi:inositol 1,4,5-trisphosphate receptor-interacting protein-like 2 [Pristis pectinata]|uniref:inositol 1,4,5-trisphosphate receptor-interacting protein-like 2 n=1 Tax=Pristis pectinata TaxID=685728 RepID=UPI00223CBAD8|nr:inositol 1,4,5-trisphosphate receptor-interacting protein-like 2 [Pristis pectinata]